MRERMLERFDKDGDGKLNEEEREAARENWRRGDARHADGRRGEGRSDDARRRRREDRRGAGRPDGPPRGDDRRGRGGPPDGRTRPPMIDPEAVFERLDRNDDGQLSLREFRGGMERMRRMRTASPPPGARDGERRRGPDGPDGPRFRRGGPDRGPGEGPRPDRPRRSRGSGPPPAGDFGPEEV